MENQNKDVKRKLTEEELVELFKDMTPAKIRKLVYFALNDEEGIDIDEEFDDEIGPYDGKVAKFIFDGLKFDSADSNPTTVAKKQGFDAVYTYDVVPAWFQIPKHPTDDDIINMKYKAVSEFCEFMTAIDDFLKNKTWKNRQKILYEFGDTVTAMTGFAVELGANAEEMVDVFDGTRLKNKVRHYHIPRWNDDDNDDGADKGHDEQVR